MKSFLSWAACSLAVMALSLGGCSPGARQNSRTLAPGASATSSYQPPYYQNYKDGQNVATSRLDVKPLSAGISGGQAAVPAVSAAPLPSVTAASALPPVAASTSGKVKAAILLPLSGPNAALGKAMWNAAQQAVFDAAGNGFELQPHDTVAEGAEGAARAALSNGARLMIGPLFASDVPPVAAIAQSAGVSVLALSTDTGLAQHGVYVLGLTPAPQVERVVAYAAAHGAKRFAALVPGTPYGAVVGQAFQNAVAQQGGAVIDYETFDQAARDGGDRAKNLAQQRDQIDALFLPVGGDDLKTIADHLVSAGFSAGRMRLLGTGLWDMPGIGKQSPLLLGAWYVAPDPAARRVFTADYAASYGQQPPRLATLAYDATALAALLAKRGSGFDDAALTNPNGFSGVDGVFRLSVNGQVDRMLAVNEVTADGAVVADPAPANFVGRPH